MDFSQNSVVGRGDNCDTEVMEILKTLKLQEPVKKTMIEIRSLSDIRDASIGTVILNGSPAWTFKFTNVNEVYLAVDINTGTRINALNRLSNTGHWANELGKHRIILYQLVDNEWVEINLVDINLLIFIKPTWTVNDIVHYLTVNNVIKSYQTESINRIKKQIDELEKQMEELRSKICELHRELYNE